MTNNQDREEISLRDQMKKFAIKSMIGFHTVLMYGIGKHLGIFNYLFDKGKLLNSEAKIKSVSFTIEELSKNLNLDMKYLDAWLHMAFECGIFEVDTSCERCAKTAPHVFDILIDQNNMFFIGDVIGGFYNTTLYQDILLDNFKTGNIGSYKDMPSSFYMDAQRMSSGLGKAVENLFLKRCRDDRKRLLKEANILEIGCGYGLNLENWVRKFKNPHFVGIDIDPNGIKHAKELVSQNNWNDRIEILEISIEKYAKTTNLKFDLVILNQVLHEMDPDENYRVNALNNIYSLLSENGIVLVGESMIPDTFTLKKEFQLYDIMHKWFEVGFNFHFYDEKSFKELIDLTLFKYAEFIKERGNYFWLVRK